MKRFVIVTIMLIVLWGCTCCDVDPYEGKRPINYPQTLWVCEEYDAYFLVDHVGELKEAKICINEQWYEFEFLWGMLDNSACIIVDVNGISKELGGRCTFEETKFTFKIQDTADCYPEEQITMVFVRTE